MKKISFILVMLVLLAGCASTGSYPTVGDQAPDFSLVDVSGNEIRLGDFKGKKNVTLIFYADNN
ncbi:MAG: redoxin domain-containing protein [Deltaproteobacteria bacterium]|jgi:peroxiredoxin|nr:redoxin domain-containing protein [Deltaproteobacteria bacterium]MBW2450323.1 redoxin domain-containing protein [Deltaproteobacteria bacterium]